MDRSVELLSSNIGSQEEQVSVQNRQGESKPFGSIGNDTLTEIMVDDVCIVSHPKFFRSIKVLRVSSIKINQHIEKVNSSVHPSCHSNEFV